MMGDLSGILLIALGLGFPLLLLTVFLKTRKRDALPSMDIDHDALSVAERELAHQGEKAWVVLKRCHGPAYTHTAMSEIISRFAAEGIEATYDVYGISSADMGITNFILKVLEKDEARAREILAEMDGVGAG